MRLALHGNMEKIFMRLALHGNMEKIFMRPKESVLGTCLFVYGSSGSIKK